MTRDTRFLDLLIGVHQVGMRRNESWNTRYPRTRMSPEERAEHDRFFPEDTEHVRWGFRLLGVTVLVLVVVAVGALIVAVTM